MAETPEQQLHRLRSAARIVAQVHTRGMDDGGPFVVDMGAYGGVLRNFAGISEDVWLRAWGDIRELTGLDPAPRCPTDAQVAAFQEAIAKTPD